MLRPTTFFALFAIAVSLGCARLGFWQLSRLRERQARNATVEARLTRPAVPVRALAADTALQFRRVTAHGRYDYGAEMALAFRSREGSPGVHVLTPLLLGGGDTAIIVNRGWVYSADGANIDFDRWGEDTVATVEGFVIEYMPASGPVTMPDVPRSIRRLDRDSTSARFPYVLLPFVVAQQIDSGVVAAAAAGTPVRVDPPPLTEGPHRAYAIQWFAFALVGISGSLVVVTRDRRGRPPPRRGPDSAGKG